MTRHQHTTDADNAADIPRDGDGQDQKLLTITEAATIVRAPVATLRYWRHLGTGPRGFRLGRRVLYRYDDLVTWIDQRHDHDPHAA